MLKHQIVPFLLLCLLQASYSQANESRIALVIGNKDYAESRLLNPVNDARDMKAALEQVGFRVIYVENANFEKMDSSVHAFVQSLNKDSVGVVYYSGHGAQVDGENYLIPIGAKISSKAEMKVRAYNAGIILDEMKEKGNPVNIVILDACRSNPFKGFRAAADGLAMMGGPKGSLIAYATAPGSVAEDGSGQNGIYTTFLKKYLVQPGLTIQDMFMKVREDVLEKNPDQVPWENSSLTGHFCFAGCEGRNNAINNLSVDSTSVELSFWNSIKDSKNQDEYEAYLEKYPNGQFVSLSKSRLKALKASSQQAFVRPDLMPITVEEQLHNNSLRVGSKGPGGGIVFYLDSSGLHGLEAQAKDVSNKLDWSAADSAASDYGSDWHLPTKDELNFLYQQKKVVGGFDNDYYWSSTESGSTTVWLQDFSGGIQSRSGKEFTYRARAIRPF